MARKPRSPEDRREGASRSRHRAPQPEDSDDRKGSRSRPEAPDGWRSLMSTDYDYPDELGDLSSRERRRAKKEWRRDDHARRMAWLRNQRRAEPTSPVAIVILVVVVAIVILGLGGGLPRLFGGKSKDEGTPISLLTPGRSVVLPTAPATQPNQPTAPSSSTLTTPPLQSQRPSGDAIALASDVVGAWSRAFYTRDPGTETYEALVAKCAKYMTPEVASSFTSAGDPTYDALKTDGGKSAVISAPVSTPPPNAEAPVDTPSRITRFVKVTIDVTGKHPQRFDVPLLITLSNQNGQWLISDVSGGTGP
ncbi:hypothetical protein PWY87_16500 [Kribbella solani]|uniref:hypothetical protein n=1 Tax=Kribbella solani TaxID=236067 RepID=UPI0029A7030B|nr:hypothetical protein [Kribbella solani]MDX3003290.1 hypothetical protein [Kribbella solani]